MAAKFRSFLTILGIIIGIASVIIIMAIGTSAQELILEPGSRHRVQSYRGSSREHLKKKGRRRAPSG